MSSKTNGDGAVGSEACENDPCIEQGDQATSPSSSNNNNKKNYFLQYKSEVSQKWGLSDKVFYFILTLVVCLVLLAIVVVALGAAYPRLRHSQWYPVCEDPSCLRAASQIREAMNSSASPCSDLWSWACGGWLAKYPLPNDRSIWNQKQQLLRQGAAKVRDLITTINLPLQVVSVEWKLKHLYETCMDVDNVNTDEARPLTNIISELGGWYILRDWNLADFDYKKVLQQLHVKYGVTPFFKISVEADPFLPGKNAIRISPAGLGLPDREYYYRDDSDRVQNAYKELIRDVVKYLSTTRNEAEKFGNDIFHYEKRIAEITPESQVLQNPIKTCNHITISELKETMLTIPFYDILTAMYHEANINETTEVIITSVEYLTEVSQIVASTDRQTMNGYLMWTLVRQYLPYLSQKFTSAVDNFNAELFGVREPPKRWEICAGLAKEFMGLAVEAMTEKADPITPQARKTVNETYRSILSVVDDRLRKFQKMPHLHMQLKQKLNTIRLQIGLGEDAKRGAFLKDFYKGLKVIKSNLFESVKYGIEFRKKLEQKRLRESLGSDFSHTEVTYSPDQNLVTVPKSYLTYPYFESQFPRSVIYGRLGVELASGILSAVLPYGSFWTGERKLLTQYHTTVNESLKSIERQKRCLHDYVLELLLDVPQNVVNESSLKVLKTLSAISVAHEALKSVPTSKHIHQPALEEYENSALYFLSFAQTQCSESTNQQQVYDITKNFLITQRSLLHIAWAQIPEFNESLECYVGKKAPCPDIF